MAKGLNQLSAVAVKNLTEPGRHADGGGLYLNIAKSQQGTLSKSWLYMFRWGPEGKRREMGLGSLRDVPLAKAREMAQQARIEVAAGVDPIKAREDRRRSKAPTFEEVAREVHKLNAPEWRNEKHAEQWINSLEQHAGKIWKRPVDTIESDDIVAVLSPIWSVIPETARRIRGRIEKVMSAAIFGGHYKGLNPARWPDHLALLLPKINKKKGKKRHHAALVYNFVPLFIARIRVNNSVSSLALEFTILTASRTSEVLLARWPEIDWKAEVWTIPPERMKPGREHRVPIVGRALAILKIMWDFRREDTGYIFPGASRDGHLSQNAMLEVTKNTDIQALVAAMGHPPLPLTPGKIRGSLTNHGFRSSFRDWSGDETHHPREVAEAALSHQLGDEAEQAYRRSDALAKRRVLMMDWEAYCQPGAAEIDAVKKVIGDGIFLHAGSLNKGDGQIVQKRRGGGSYKLPRPGATGWQKEPDTVS